MPPQTGPTTDQLNQIAEKIRSANSILVTVSSNPSVDQLAACIGLTLAINKMDKHGTAVYSGRTPSTIEFLKPEKTLERDTNSLRDFIISLDKSKADKLRYKVEDEVVKIFITPYRTSITEKDFNFSQGDFNVDVVLALGVNNKSDLDRAITSHGRILHDATVISLNTSTTSGESPIGSLEWVPSETSSLCEMVTDLIEEMDSSILDNQIATALLTGVVVETARFSNEKSKPHTMQVSGKLMESGASTQLITTKLEEGAPTTKQSGGKEGKDGLLQIEHTGEDEPKKEDAEIPPVAPADKQPEPKEEPPKPAPSESQSSQISDVRLPDEEKAKEDESDSGVNQGPSYVGDPPSMGGRLTANDIPEHDKYDPSTDPLSQGNNPSIINRPKPDDSSAQDQPQQDQDMNGKTLHDIEQSVESPHLNQDQGSSASSQTQSDTMPPEDDKVRPVSVSPTSDDDNSTDNSDDSSTTDNGNANDSQQPGQAPPAPPVDDARDAVQQAMDSSDNQRLDPIQSLNAQEFDAGNNGDSGSQDQNGSDSSKDDSNNKPPSSSPPPVPPPMMPPSAT